MQESVETTGGAEVTDTSYVDQLIQEAEAKTKTKERKPREKKPTNAKTKPPKPAPEPLYIAKKDEDGNIVLDEHGQPVMEVYVKPTIQRKPREPKLVPQLNEDGTPVLGEDGQPVMVAAQRAGRVVPSSERAVIRVTEEQAAKLAKYGGDRGHYASMLKDGQQIGDYLQAGGDRGFLRFYVRDGACTVEDAGPVETQ